MNKGVHVNYQRLISGYPALFSNFNAPIRIITDHKRVTSWQKQRRVEFTEQGKPLHWATIGVVLDDPYVLAVRDLVEFPDGWQNGYIRVINRADLEGGQGTVVLPMMESKFLLLYQFRHATRSWHYEVPRGFGQPGTSAEQQAHNEILEEVGGKIAELVDLGILHNNTGLEGNNVKLFFARLASVGELAKVEGIERILWVSLGELEEMIASGKITDGFTIAAYTRAKLRGLL